MPVEGLLLRQEFIPWNPWKPRSWNRAGRGGGSDGKKGGFPFCTGIVRTLFWFASLGGHARRTTALSQKVTVTSTLWVPCLRKARGKDGSASLCRDGLQGVSSANQVTKHPHTFLGSKSKAFFNFQGICSLPKVKNHGVRISVFHWEAQSSPRITQIWGVDHCKVIGEDTWSLHHICLPPTFSFSPPLFSNNSIREKREMEVEAKRHNEHNNVRGAAREKVTETGRPEAFLKIWKRSLTHPSTSGNSQTLRCQPEKNQTINQIFYYHWYNLIHKMYFPEVKISSQSGMRMCLSPQFF